MCGIFGSITREGLEGREIDQISRVLYPRGPDDEGRARIEAGGAVIDLIHRRLSIIDLSSRAHQPMCDESGTAWIVYNGEIYNYREIKEELVQKGYRFRSDSDTEVALKSYREWGTDCAKKFVGMFAFAVFDKSKNRFFIFRDHAGIKPLYYYSRDGIFMFSSELKSFFQVPGFKKEIDREALYLYLLFGYVPSPYSIFENTNKLEAGCILEVDLEGGIKRSRWWNADDYHGREDKYLSFDESKEALKEKLLASFRYRLVADVPVGVFLSGGIDSTLITTLLQRNMDRPLRTFTIGFHEKGYNEAAWAKNIAEYLKTEHTEFFCTPSDVMEVMKKLPQIYDEPFADSSGIPTYLLSRLSRERVKVCLSGDGGDELLGGYDRYKKIKLFYRLLHLPFALRKHLIRKLGFTARMKFISEDKIFKTFSMLNSENFSQSYVSLVSYWNPYQLSELMGADKRHFHKLFSEEVEGDSLAEKAMRWDFNYYLPDDLLTKVDRASMANGLEARVPILDKEVCQYSFKIPLRHRWNKKILKSIISDYLPNDLFYRPKQGFRVPIYEWFRKDLKELFARHLSKTRLDSHGLLNTDYVLSVLARYLDRGNVSVHKLWAVLMFQMWYEEWMGKK